MNWAQHTIIGVGTAVGIAKDQSVPLGGIEVIFYADEEPFVGCKATPPWSAQDIMAALLSKERRRKIEEKEETPPVRPTVPMLGG
jgi:hypothetical protein